MHRLGTKSHVFFVQDLHVKRSLSDEECQSELPQFGMCVDTSLANNIFVFKVSRSEM